MRSEPSRALLVSLAPTKRPVAGIRFSECLGLLVFAVNRRSLRDCDDYDTGAEREGDGGLKHLWNEVCLD